MLNKRLTFVILLITLLLFGCGTEDIISQRIEAADAAIEEIIEEETYNFIEIDINKRYLHEEMVEDIYRLIAAYPFLVESEIIGQSEDNRDIYLLKLGKGNLKSLMLGGVHAREIAATPLLIKMVNEYAKHYYLDEEFDDFNVKELLDNTILYIVPLVNPDGMEIVIHKENAIYNEEIRETLKNIPGQYNNWKANAKGVDINRNFTCENWAKVLPGKKKSDLINSSPHAQFYSGTHPASEKETQAIENLVKNNDFKIMFDIHSKGRVIYWYKEIMDEEFNDRAYHISQEVEKYSGYAPLPKNLSTHGMGTDGTSTDFAVEQGIYSLTIETMLYDIPSPFPVDLIVKEWEKVKSLGLVLAQETIKDSF